MSYSRPPFNKLSFHFELLFLMGNSIEMKLLTALGCPLRIENGIINGINCLKIKLMELIMEWTMKQRKGSEPLNIVKWAQWAPKELLFSSLLHQSSINLHQHKLKKFSFVEWIGWIDLIDWREEEKIVLCGRASPTNSIHSSIINFKALNEIDEMNGEFADC